MAGKHFCEVQFLSFKRTGATQTETMEDSLSETLLQELKCPVCDNYMYPPIRQCIKGHSICDHCFPKLRSCPLCRRPKSQARCFVLESIQSKLTVPCRYRRDGCKHHVIGANILTHEKFCKFAPRTCPFKSYYNCQWRDTETKLLGHCRRRHNSNFYQSDREVFVCDNFNQIQTSVYYYIVLHAHGKFFRLTWDVDVDTGITSWAVYYMGDPLEAKAFSYKLEFIPDDPTACGGSITWKSPCVALPEDDSDRFVGHNFLTVHADVVRKYCDSNGGLSYRATIYNSGDSQTQPHVQDLVSSMRDIVFD